MIPKFVYPGSWFYVSWRLGGSSYNWVSLSLRPHLSVYLTTGWIPCRKNNLDANLWTPPFVTWTITYLRFLKHWFHNNSFPLQILCLFENQEKRKNIKIGWLLVVKEESRSFSRYSILWWDKVQVEEIGIGIRIRALAVTEIYILGFRSDPHAGRL